MDTITPNSYPRVPGNKGKLVGQKAPLRISEIWAIRVRLEIFGRLRDLALFNLAIDSKLRGCDLVRLRVLMFATACRLLIVPVSFNRRPSNQFSLS